MTQAELLQYLVDTLDSLGIGYMIVGSHASIYYGEADQSRILLNDVTPPYVRAELKAMGYDAIFRDRTSGPINAIFFDRKHGTFQGGSSNHGDDYGIAW